MVEWGKYGFREVIAAVEAFVELVAGSVFASFNYVFSFFFEVVFALEVLTGYLVSASWS